MSQQKLKNAERLRAYFDEVASTTQIGGAAVLAKLGTFASACIVGGAASQGAVAFALATVFEKHAEDRDDRPVTGEDTYLLMSLGFDDLNAAVNFIKNGGSTDDAISIIANLAKLTPDRIYGRTPQSNDG